MKEDLFSRPPHGTTAVIIHVVLDTEYDEEEQAQELIQLVHTAGFLVQQVVTMKRKQIDRSFFIGKGQLASLNAIEYTSDVLIISHDLSPSQQRNIERMVKKRVIARTELILHIFSQRAQSHEGKLQVELAQLEHLSTHLVRGWTHLERQKGGIGLRGGPGETQLEIDRRLLRQRTKRVREKLNQLKTRRNMQRQARQRANTFSIVLVGYTNAGKSTLFNRLSKSNMYVADKLFATLDTTTHRLFIDEHHTVVLSDTVGFIQGLPHSLINAFSATLEEAVQANILLHVVDSSHAHRQQHIQQVNKVLHEIGAGHVPQILVYTQIDRTNILPLITRDEYGNITGVRVSAVTGAGLVDLRQTILEYVQKSTAH